MTKKPADTELGEIARRTEADLDDLARQIDKGETPALAVRRGRGQPPIGPEPGEPLRVRLEPESRRAVDERAEAKHTSTSDIVRRAIRQYLAAS